MDDDEEADFQRELAALQDASDGEEFGFASLLVPEETDISDELLDPSEDEPDSMRVYRQALERRECQVQAFQLELSAVATSFAARPATASTSDQAQQVATTVTPTHVEPSPGPSKPGSSISPDDLPVRSNEQTDATGGVDAPSASALAVTGTMATEEPAYSRSGPSGAIPPMTHPASPTSSASAGAASMTVAEAMAGIVAHAAAAAAASAAATCDPAGVPCDDSGQSSNFLAGHHHAAVTSAVSAAAAGDLMIVLVAGSSTAAAVDDTSDALLAERDQLYKQYKEEEAERDRVRQAQRQEAEAEARRVQLAAETLAQQRMAEAERQQQARLAALQQAADQAACLLAEEQAADAAEAARRVAEQQALAARLQQQAAATAAREAQRAATAAALREAQAVAAQRQSAATRIAAAWRTYAMSPARAARLAAITKVQALARGRRDRRVAAALASRRAVLRGLEEAAARGTLEGMREAARQAETVGLGGEVSARLAAFEAEAKGAADRLTAAATSWTAMAFQPALQAATKFVHLQHLVEDSRKAFAARQAAALTALQAAIADSPMVDLTRLSEVASQLGVDPTVLTAALDTARMRDAAAAAAALAAARAVPFDGAAFAAAVEWVGRLGLRGDAATARLLLDKRRQGATRGLQTRAAGADANTVKLMIADVRGLGAEREAAALEAELSRRQVAAAAALARAAGSGGAEAFQRAVAQASRMGLSMEVIQGAEQQLAKRRQHVTQQLHEAADGGTLAQFDALRPEALRVGCEAVVDAAQRKLSTRRTAATAALKASITALFTALDAASPQQKFVKPSGLTSSSQTTPLTKSVSECTAGAFMQQLSSVLWSVLGLAGQQAGHVAVGTPGKQQVGSDAGSAAARSGGAVSTSYITANGGTKASATRSDLKDPPTSVAAPIVSPAAAVAALVAALPDVLPARPAQCLELYCQSSGAPSLPSTTPAATNRSADVRQAVQQLWSRLRTAAQLGLNATAVPRAVSLLRLFSQVRGAQRSSTVVAAAVARDYWGTLALPSWPGEAAEDGCGTLFDGAVGGHEGGSGAGRVDGITSALVDEVAHQAARRMQHRGASGRTLWMWPPSVPVQALVQLWRHWRDVPPAPAPSSQSIAASRAAAGHPAVVPPVRPARGTGGGGTGGGTALNRSMLVANAPGGDLSAVLRLDLGLERLTSLAGLDALCCSLQVLLANVNQLTSLQGVQRLHDLQELSLKDNRLSSLEGLSGLRKLSRLALDSNELSGTLAGLEHCSQLQVLSICDNQLDHLGDGLLGCCATLQTLSLAGNRLSGVQGLARCAALTALDITRNGLQSLEGISACSALQTLNAAHNALTSLPPHLALPLLRELQLGNNAITSFPPVAACGGGGGSGNTGTMCGDSGSSYRASLMLLPSLQVLGLQDNGLAEVSCPLFGMYHLRELDLSFNSLPDLAQLLHCLTPLAGLRNLRINDNPMLAALAAAAAAGQLAAEDQPPPPAGAPAHLAAAAAPAGPVLPSRQPPKHAAQVLTILPWLSELDLFDVGASASVADRAEMLGSVATTSPWVVLATSRLLRATPSAVLWTMSRHTSGAEVAQEVQQPSEGNERWMTSSASSCDPGICGDATQAGRATRGQPARALALAMPSILPQVHLGAASGGLTDGDASHDASAQCDERLWELHDCFSLVTQQHCESEAVQALRPRGAGATASVLTASLMAPQQMADMLAAPRGACQVADSLPDMVLDAPPLRKFRGLAASLQTLSFGGPIPARGLRIGTAAVAVGSAGVGGKRAGTVADGCTDGGSAPTQQQYEVQYVESTQGLPFAHLEQLRGAAGQASEHRDVFTVRPSYLERQRVALGLAAARIQAGWRGRLARKEASRLRDGQYRQQLWEACRSIQAVWRGHAVRTGPQLAALKAKRDAERKAAAEALAAVQDAAAVKIQAMARGFGVRRRLKAALQASKYVDDDDFDYGGVEDDFLAPVRNLVDEAESEQRAAMAAAMATANANAAAAARQRQQDDERRRQLAAAAAAASAVAAAASAAATSPASQSPLQASRPTPLAIHDASDGPGGPSPPPTGAPHRAWGTPPYTTDRLIHAAGQGGFGVPASAASGYDPVGGAPPPHGSQPQWQPSNGYNQPAMGYNQPAMGYNQPAMSGDGAKVSSDGNSWGDGRPSYDGDGGLATPGSNAGSITSAAGLAQAARQEKYTQKLQALMAEWGFKDLATAEAYYKRTQRVTHGQVRQQMQAKFRDPEHRLKKLQVAMSHQPALRPDDIHRAPVRGPEIAMHPHSLEGPPSRGSSHKPPLANGAAAAAPPPPYAAPDGRRAGPPAVAQRSASLSEVPTHVRGGGGYARRPGGGGEDDQLSIHSFASDGAGHRSPHAAAAHSLARKPLVAASDGLGSPGHGRPLLPHIQANNWVLAQGPGGQQGGLPSGNMLLEVSAMTAPRHSVQLQPLVAPPTLSVAGGPAGPRGRR